VNDDDPREWKDYAEADDADGWDPIEQDEPYDDEGMSE
jgi:hypothetical protein